MAPRNCYPALLLFLLICASTPTARPRGRTGAHSWSALQTQDVVPQGGVFLVARPGMEDPRFRRTVILLLTHDRQGSLGVILNRPTEVPFNKLFPGQNDSGSDSQRIFYGGPVGLERVMFVARSAQPLERATRVLDDIYFGGDRTTLETLLKEGKTTAELRLFLGYSGWAAGQLAGEIEQGAWKLFQADPTTVFEGDVETIWRDMMERLERDRYVVWKTAPRRGVMPPRLP